LREDSRVVLFERTNFRTLSPEKISEPIDIAVADVSFISLTKILPRLFPFLKPGGDAVVPALNRYLEAFDAKRLLVVATRDWHPANHASFREQGGPWPTHCVHGTPGAEFAPGLQLPRSTLVISKGSQRERDAYSGFQGTNLDERLRDAGIHRLFIGGLATDYCVLSTVKDALGGDFSVYLLEDAIRAVNAHPEDGRKAQEEMVRLGAVPIRFEDVAHGA
jgi:nicotinamidase/pyrazinamidase